MGLLDFFRKRRPPLPEISYGIAYFILPHFAFKETKNLLHILAEDPDAAASYFYALGCDMAKSKPIRAEALQFRWHRGDLDEGWDGHALEYPVPPPVNFAGEVEERLQAGERLVLAPHFSAVVAHRATGRVSYFVLGQSPGGGTTFREVTAEHANCNLGPGPQPELQKFLDHLRSWLSAEEKGETDQKA